MDVLLNETISNKTKINDFLVKTFHFISSSLVSFLFLDLLTKTGSHTINV